MVSLFVGVVHQAEKIKNLMADKAGDLAGSDPDYAIRDLYNAIKKGEFVSWSFISWCWSIQVAEFLIIALCRSSYLIMFRYSA